MGVPLDKTVGPDTALQFEGIRLDSVRMEARLPEEKLQKCRNLLTDFFPPFGLFKGAPVFNRIIKFYLPYRASLRRLIDLTKGITKPHYHIRISRAAKQDLTMWLQFLTEFNGRSFFLNDIWETSQTLQLFTDAAGSIGFGAVFGAHWFHGLWPTTWHDFKIAILELFPIVLAVHIWGACMADKCVIFFSDNAAVVDIINKQTSKKSAIMVLLRDLVLSCLRHNILFQARHILGFNNSRADYLSRSQVTKFQQITQDADKFPTPIPENLLSRNWFLL